MQITDWLVVILVVAIVGVLLDAVRRRVLERRNRIVVKLDRNLPPAADFDEELLASAELPNGGARTLPRQDRPVPTLRNLKSTRKATLTQPRDTSSDKMLGAVPVLMDAVELEEERIEHTNVFVDTGTAAAYAADNLDREQQFAVPVPAEEENAEWDAENQDCETADETANDVDMHYEEDAPMLRQEAEHRPQVRDTRYQGGDEDDDFDLDDDFEDEEDEDDEDDDEEFDEDGLPLSDDDFDDEDDDFDDDDDEDEDDDYDDDEDEDDEEEDEEDDEDEEDLDELEGLPEDEWGSEEEQDVLVDDYENEPVLLQDAYTRAAGHFVRSDPQPRIEPGFGDEQFNEEELNEDFSEAARESSEELQHLAEAIRPVPVLRRPPPAAQAAPALAPTSAQPTGQTPSAAAAPIPVPAAPESELARQPEFAAAPASDEPTEKPVLSRAAQPDLFQEEPRPKAALKPLKRKASEPAPPPPEPVYSGPQEVIVINVMARSGQTLSGAELLPLLLQLGLRLGDMSIFHRHAEDDGSGPVLFSMANMVKPGTFDLATMDQFTTPGLSFFMQMPNKYGNMACFDRMLHAASALRNTLDAELKDEHRSVFTRQTVEHCRQRVRDFELLLLSKKQ